MLREHASIEHGYMIKDVKKILVKRGVYREVSTSRKLNRILLNGGRSVIPDVIAKTYGIENEYYEKGARLLSKYGVKRDDLRVIDTTSNKSTRLFLVLNDGTFGISSVIAKVLCSRANGEEKVAKGKDAGSEEIVKEDGNDAEYSNIGINKIDSMLRSPNCPFVLFVGSKKLVKSKEFEQFISQALII